MIQIQAGLIQKPCGLLFRYVHRLGVFGHGSRVSQQFIAQRPFLWALIKIIARKFLVQHSQRRFRPFQYFPHLLCARV